MAEIKVFEAAFLKPGPGITNASFAQVLWDQNKKEYTVPLEIASQQGNIYRVFPFSGAYGKIEVSASGFKSSRVDVVEEPLATTKEVFLSR